MSIHEIIYESINEKFSYGKYGDFKVIICRENYYINATKLCSEHGKRFDHWLQNDQSKELIQKVNYDLKKEGKSYESTMLITGGKGEISQLVRGTYVDQIIIADVAKWISIDFRIKVYKILNSYLFNEYKDKLRESKKVIKEKDDKIDEVLRQLRKANKRAERMERKLDVANEQLDEANGKLDMTNEKLDMTNEELFETKTQLKTISKKLDIASDERVPPTKSITKLEDFALLRNKRKKADYRYYVIRGQPSYVNKKIDIRLDDKFEVVLRIKDVANSVNLYNRLKEQLKKKAEFSANYINLLKIKEEDFIGIINDIYDERKDIIVESSDDESDSDSE